MDTLLKKFIVYLPAIGYWVGACVLFLSVFTVSNGAATILVFFGSLVMVVIAIGLTRRLKWAFVMNALLLFLSVISLISNGRFDPSILAEVIPLFFIKEFYSNNAKI